MAKYGERQSRFLRTPPRSKSHRRPPVHLSVEHRYLLAVDLMNGMAPRDVSEKWGVTQSCVSNIKYEFLEVVTVWKEGVLDKFKGVVPKGLDSILATGVAAPKK